MSQGFLLLIFGLSTFGVGFCVAEILQGIGVLQ